MIRADKRKKKNETGIKKLQYTAYKKPILNKKILLGKKIKMIGKRNKP